jgi:RecA-family ATPase
VLVVFDTQSRCAVGIEENQSSAMSVLVDALDKLRVVTGACVLTVHHTPRTATNLRGSNSQEGAATTIIAVEKDGPLVTVSAETARGGKQKDFAARPPMRMALKPFAGSATLTIAANTVGDRARRVLETMGDQQWSLTALVTHTELSKSTIVRALHDLEHAALVVKTEGSCGPLYQAA